ncbi:putative bifunctional diguanylate cyclase/phosphodiesterase [Neptuniibacter marinus]|uniref:putative bifunctional diguanylate cyclase/phosphodiesterase n=1 Tax=Neptuniibacter marinus TaxID=1806670 RepID=UPI000835DCE2|nr:EAL domain-containing protein [Neptuniibacter marinus]
MTDVHASSRSFFSLRWKVFIYLVFALTMVHLIYGYYSYLSLEKKSEQQRLEFIKRDVDVLEGLVATSYDRLLNLAEIIPLVVNKQYEGNIRSEAYTEVIGTLFPDLVMSGSMDAIYFYDSAGKLVVKDGIFVDFPVSVITQVQEIESPVKFFHCAEQCLRFIAMPVTLENSQVGVVVVGREMRDIILEFNHQTGRDIGLALQPAESVDDARLQMLELKYLTQKSENEMLLNTLVSEQHISAEGGVYEVDANNRHYQILLKAPEGTIPGQAYWILIEDHTNTYIAARDDLIQSLLVSGSGLLVAALFLLTVLRSPLSALAKVSSLLPLLAKSSYEDIRLGIHTIKRSNIFEDELDLLQNSTLEVSQQLEYLETSLLERAENLTERSVQLEAERDFVTSLLNTAEAIIMTLDDEGNIETINRFGLGILGLNNEEVTSLSFFDLEHDQQDVKEHQALMERLLNKQENKIQILAGIRAQSGQVLQISWLHSALNIPDSNAQVLSIGMDVTERQHAEKSLEWIANHDSLTALPNRLMFNNLVEQALARHLGGEDIIAVLFCDLDSFKDVNDSLGHPVGDELLKQAAERIQNVISTSDILARLGGDEFTVLLEACSSVQELEDAAAHILTAFREPFIIDGYEIFSTLSIGIAIYPEHAVDVTTLVQYADVAMFDAKERGKNQLRFYHDERGSERYERFSLINDLRRALERDELKVYFQPQIDTSSGSVMGAEALLRWQHKELGMISPAKFIPLAEEQGLIVPIGEWVLREACKQGKILHDEGIHICMGVNVAGQQIMHESLLSTVQQVIHETGIDPKLVDLEVTENFLLRQPEITIPKLQKIREMGISLSMDDFGTGYSSLSYLKKLPLNTLKIDQSFVRDIGIDPEGEAIVKAIIVLAKSLGLKVLAEGVETSEQLAYLRLHGCHLIQGYYFSRPLPGAELVGFVANQAVDITFE